MNSSAFLSESRHRVDRSFMRIHHALSQLSLDDLWWRPHVHMNSIGHLILHLEGNLTQWIIDPLSRQTNHRERKEEFKASNSLTVQEAMQLTNNLHEKVKKALSTFPSKDLNSGLNVQAKKTNYLSAIYASITHLEGHVGQIIYITHQRKGADYQLFDHYGLNEQLGDYS